MDGTLTTYLLDTATPLTMVLAEQTGTGPAIYYLHGLDPVAQNDGAATEYFAYDGLGSVRQVMDEAGSPLLTQTFDPYGSLYAHAGIAEMAWGFTGEQTDANGLLYLRARYYAPSQGRFFQLDPSRQEVNLYQYGLGNPVTYSDPTGETPVVCALLTVFGLVADSPIPGPADIPAALCWAIIGGTAVVVTEAAVVTADITSDGSLNLQFGNSIALEPQINLGFLPGPEPVQCDPLPLIFELTSSQYEYEYFPLNPEFDATRRLIFELGGYQPYLEQFPLLEQPHLGDFILLASKKDVLKRVGLPTEGRIRYVPPESWSATEPLPRGPNHGYMDRFDNEWVKGPSRTLGESFEWDVQLSRTGREQLGWLSSDGRHINVSLTGRITH